MRKKSQQIETQGNMSPGYVGRDFIINQTIIDQYNSSQRKKWRQLEHAYCPVLQDNSNFRVGFLQHIAIALHNTFLNNGYTRFVNNLRTFKEVINDNELVFYELVSHQPTFCEQLRREYSKSIERILDIKEKGDINDLENLKKEFIERWNSYFYDWKLSHKVIFSNDWMPTEFIYDPATKQITIQAIDILTANPKDYEEGITTTSELFQFIASVIKLPIIYLGDFVWLKENYPLMKLFIEISDNQQYRLDRVRVNAHDYEEWDYVNRDFDEEVRTKKAKKEAK